MGILKEAEVIKVLGINIINEKKETPVFSYGLSINPEIELFPFPYGKNIQNTEKASWIQIAMTHQMIIENKVLWPDQTAPKGNSILKKFKEFSLILSGDNHNAFTVEHEGRWLVNPGSLMRTTTDQESHKPRVYLWYAETNEIKPVYLPIEQNVISRTHIDIAKNREIRNQAFITRVNEDIEIDLKYEENLKKYFARYRTEKPVENKVWDSVK